MQFILLNYVQNLLFNFFFQIAHAIISQRLYGSRTDLLTACSAGFEEASKVFENWKKEVIQSFPPNQLLIYDVSEGWEPLCNFLKVPVPDIEFPHENKKSFILKRMFWGKIYSAGIISTAIVTGVITTGIGVVAVVENFDMEAILRSMGNFFMGVSLFYRGYYDPFD